MRVRAQVPQSLPRAVRWERAWHQNRGNRAWYRTVRSMRHGPASSPDLNRQRILAVVDSIPAGQVASYGQVAMEAGLARRARLVGRILASLPKGSGIPWYRVINSSARISLAGAAAQRQARLLRAEGVKVSSTLRVDWRGCRWQPQ